MVAADVIRDDGTVTLLHSDGTTWHGVVVLRISVSTGTGFGASHAVRCYRYVLTRYTNGDPEAVDCPKQ